MFKKKCSWRNDGSCLKPPDKHVTRAVGHTSPLPRFVTVRCAGGLNSHDPVRKKSCHYCWGESLKISSVYRGSATMRQCWGQRWASPLFLFHLWSKHFSLWHTPCLQSSVGLTAQYLTHTDIYSLKTNKICFSMPLDMFEDRLLFAWMCAVRGAGSFLLTEQEYLIIRVLKSDRTEEYFLGW